MTNKYVNTNLTQLACGFISFSGWYLLSNIVCFVDGCRARDRMIVGFTTT